MIKIVIDVKNMSKKIFQNLKFRYQNNFLCQAHYLFDFGARIKMAYLKIKMDLLFCVGSKLLFFFKNMDFPKRLKFLQKGLNKFEGELSAGQKTDLSALQ